MPTLPFLRRRAGNQTTLDQHMLAKAVMVAMRPDVLTHEPERLRPELEKLAKAIQSGASWPHPTAPPGGHVRQPPRPLSVADVAQRATQALMPSVSTTPADVEIALRAQGLDWVEPFAPGRPLTPYYGYSRRPREFNYLPGRNVSTDTRPERIPFGTLKQLNEGYDVAITCIRHTINDLRSMKLEFGPMDGYEGDVSKDVAQAKQFLRRPDGKRPFTTWFCEWAMDVLRYDAGALARERDRTGKVVALKVVDGTTIAPMVDYFGDTPEPPATAYQQMIQGIPFNSLTTDDLIYCPQWPIPESPYGVAAIETVLINANTDLRLQLFFLQFFTAGSVPEMLLTAPSDQSDSDSLQDWQDMWDDWYENNQSGRHGARWIPDGSKPFPYKPTTFDPNVAEYVMRRTVAAFGLVPADLGFTDDVNRACYSEDTEVLTEHGWKRHADWQPGERIAAYDPESRSLQYTVPTRLHVYPYQGDMVRFRSDQVDMLVTPDHRMWARGRSEEHPHNQAAAMLGVREARMALQVGHRNRSGWSAVAAAERAGISRQSWQAAEAGLRVRPSTATAIGALLPEVQILPSAPDWPMWRKVQAQELERAGGGFWFADQAGWEGVEVRDFVLPGCTGQGHGVHTGTYPARRIPMDLWLEFLGYVVSEGCVFKSRTRYSVSLAQDLKRNADKAAKIDRCLERLPFAFRSRVDKGQAMRWQVCDKALWRWLAAHIGHHAGEKRLPTFVGALSRRQLQILLDALVLGDGSRDAAPNATNFAYFSKSQQLADEVQVVALKCGHRAQVAYSAGAHVWRVGMSAPRPLGFGLRRRNIAREPYSGTVWCFSVPPQGLFLTRRNGHVAIASNTADTQMDTQFRVTTLPNTEYYQAILDSVLQDDLQLPVAVHFDTGRENEDRLMEAQAHQLYVAMGAESPDEVRDKVLGFPVSNENRLPRFYNNARLGTIPLSYIVATAGQIDPATLSPKAGTVKPEDFMAVAAGSGAAAPDVTPLSPPSEVPAPDHRDPVPGSDRGLHEQRQGMHAGRRQPEASGALVTTKATEGIVAATGIAGVDLGAADLTRWQRQSRERIRRGKRPRHFQDHHIPDAHYQAVWAKLQNAASKEEVDEAFAKAEGPPGPKGLSPQTERGDELAAQVAPAVAIALAAGWTAEQLVLEVRGLSRGANPDVALAEVGLQAAIADALEGVLQPVIELAVQDAGGFVEAATGVSPEAVLRSGGLARVLSQMGIELRGVAQQSITRIGDELAEGIRQGDASEALAARIAPILDDPKRAKVIARTEVARAMEAASQAQAISGGLAMKSWLTANDQRVCPECAANEAQGRIPITAPFASGDPHPPGHPECRCTEVFSGV